MGNTQYNKDGELSEKAIHKAIIQWVRIHPYFKEDNRWKLVMHFANEGKRTPQYGKLLKELGLREGVHDLFIATPRHGYGGFWLEIKSKNGYMSKAQKEFSIDMRKQNYFVRTAWSIEEGIKFISWYFGI